MEMNSIRFYNSISHTVSLRCCAEKRVHWEVWKVLYVTLLLEDGVDMRIKDFEKSFSEKKKTLTLLSPN